MPSDERVERALEALAGPRETFLSAVSTSVGEVRSLLREHGPSDDGRADRTAVELGPFAAGRIDAEGFATLFEGEELLDADAIPAVEEALAALVEVAEAGDELFVARVPSGGDLAATVADALAAAGRAFGAARTVELARIGRYSPEVHGEYVRRFAVEAWNRAERRIAPPLVVEVEGGDLRADALADHLDGCQKLVLVVRGDAPPAPLAGLVSPGVFVAQTGDAGDLDVAGASDGPAVAAWLPDGAARFVHDPAAGAGLRGRLRIEHLPEEEPTKPLGRRTAFRQAEGLRQLRVLAGAAGAATPEEAAATTAPATEEVTPEDKLAAWLLRQADFSDAG